ELFRGFWLYQTVMKSFFVGIIAFVLTPALGVAQSYINTDSSYRMSYVRIAMTLRPDTEYIADASAHIRGVVRQGNAPFRFRLSFTQRLTIDSIVDLAGTVSFDRMGDSLFVDLNRRMDPGQLFDVTIYYHGYSRGAYIHAFHDCPSRTGPLICW